MAILEISTNILNFKKVQPWKKVEHPCTLSAVIDIIGWRSYLRGATLVVSEFAIIYDIACYIKKCIEIQNYETITRAS
jgi:hypothetical protein